MLTLEVAYRGKVGQSLAYRGPHFLFKIDALSHAGEPPVSLRMNGLPFLDFKFFNELFKIRFRGTLMFRHAYSEIRS